MTPPAASGAARLTAPAPAPRRETERPRPPLRVVDPKDGRRRNPLAGLNAGRIGTIAGIALFVSLFALAAFQTVIIKTQANIDAINARIESEQVIQRDLALQRASLRSPERIMSAAAELGLISPGSVTYLQPTPADDAAAALASTAGDGPGAPRDSTGGGSAGPTTP